MAGDEWPDGCAGHGNAAIRADVNDHATGVRRLAPSVGTMKGAARWMGVSLDSTQAFCLGYENGWTFGPWRTADHVDGHVDRFSLVLETDGSRN